MIGAVISTKLVDDKRLQVDIAAIQEFIETNDINKIKWFACDNQLANCMKKKAHQDIRFEMYYNMERCLVNL